MKGLGRAQLEPFGCTRLQAVQRGGRRWRGEQCYKGASTTIDSPRFGCLKWNVTTDGFLRGRGASKRIRLATGTTHP